MKTILKLCPIFIIYLVLYLIFGDSYPVSDRLRYWNYSSNLLNGYFFDEIYTLWSGPGYPSYISFLRIFGFSYKIIVFTNTILLFTANVIFYKYLLKLKFYKPLLFTYIFALWEPVLLYQYLPHLMTEVFVFFLFSLLVYFIFLNKNTVYAGIVLGFLTLTKPIMLYVTLITVLVFLFHLFKKNKSFFGLKILGISLFVCLPYMIYTYSLTDKLFYISNAGGLQLYWMSVNDQNLRGDWNGYGHYSQNTPNSAIHDYNKHIKEMYWPFMDSLENLDWIQHDEKLKSIAIKNILDNKINFMKNWINNLGRLFFGYPFSFHTPNWQHILITFKQTFYFPLFLVSVILSILNYKNLPNEIQFIFFIILIYIGGTSLLSAYPRFLFVLNPLTWVLIVYNLMNFKLSVKNE